MLTNAKCVQELVEFRSDRHAEKEATHLFLVMIALSRALVSSEELTLREDDL